MRRVLCDRLPQKNDTVELPVLESNHLIQVLRLDPETPFELLDGSGHYVTAVWERHGKSVVARALQQPQTDSTRLSVPLQLMMGLLKGDAMEWVVEKAVELGVRQLTPILHEFTVVRVEKKGPEQIQSRLQKIADQSLKQCGRLDRLQIATPLDFYSATLSLSAGAHYVCDEIREGKTLITELRSRPLPTPQPVTLWVGPEGGFSPKERQEVMRNPALIRCHLGPLILRAETAAIAACAQLQGIFYEHRNT